MCCRQEEGPGHNWHSCSPLPVPLPRDGTRLRTPRRRPTRAASERKRRGDYGFGGATIKAEPERDATAYGTRCSAWSTASLQSSVMRAAQGKRAPRFPSPPKLRTDRRLPHRPVVRLVDEVLISAGCGDGPARTVSTEWGVVRSHRGSPRRRQRVVRLARASSRWSCAISRVDHERRARPARGSGARRWAGRQRAREAGAHERFAAAKGLNTRAASAASERQQRRDRTRIGTRGGWLMRNQL